MLSSIAVDSCAAECVRESRAPAYCYAELRHLVEPAWFDAGLTPSTCFGDQHMLGDGDQVVAELGRNAFRSRNPISCSASPLPILRDVIGSIVAKSMQTSPGRFA